MLKVKSLGLVIMILVCVPSILKAQSESSLVSRVEQVIRNREPEWKSSRGIQSGRVPTVSSERTLLTSLWERKLKNGGRQSISVNLYEVESPSEAAIWLSPIGEGKIAAGWSVEKFEIGDEAYLSSFQNGRRYSLYFRKENIIVEVSGESLAKVKRFAEYVVSQIAAS
jgi:hypothetical protein